MSSLSMRLKQRAKMLAAGLTLSAAALAIVPGAAEATGCIDPCTVGGLGDAANTNSADYTVGQVAVQDGVDLASNLDASPNTTALSPDSYQESASQQTIDSGYYGGGQNVNEADHTIGQVAVQDGVDSGLNANTNPNTTALSPGSFQESYNTQDVYGDSSGDAQNTNSADYTVGQVALQDGVDSGLNANVTPNTTTLSPGSYQESTNQQDIGASNHGTHSPPAADRGASVRGFEQRPDSAALISDGVHRKAAPACRLQAPEGAQPHSGSDAPAASLRFRFRREWRGEPLRAQIGSASGRRSKVIKDRERVEASEDWPGVGTLILTVSP